MRTIDLDMSVFRGFTGSIPLKPKNVEKYDQLRQQLLLPPSITYYHLNLFLWLCPWIAVRVPLTPKRTFLLR